MSKFNLQASREECWELSGLGVEDVGAEPASRGTGTFARLAAALGAALGGWYMRRLERRAIAALQELDDRTLRDIGVDRSSIPGVVRHGRYADTARFQRHPD